MKDSQQKKNFQQPRLQWCDGVLLMHIQTSAYKICFRGFHTEKKNNVRGSLAFSTTVYTSCVQPKWLTEPKIL